MELSGAEGGEGRGGWMSATNAQRPSDKQTTLLRSPLVASPATRVNQLGQQHQQQRHGNREKQTYSTFLCRVLFCTVRT